MGINSILNESILYNFLETNSENAIIPTAYSDNRTVDTQLKDDYSHYVTIFILLIIKQMII